VIQENNLFEQSNIYFVIWQPAKKLQKQVGE
jgi:hypothetical protein